MAGGLRHGDVLASGLYSDGDPGGDTGDPGSPPARISAASIAFRDPDSGAVRKYAWGFDQGPCEGKPGRVRRPREGGGVESLDVERLLAGLAKAGFGRGLEPVPDRKGNPTDKTRTVPYTPDEAYRAIGADHWVRLLRWLRARDRLAMHNMKFDRHTTADGLRPEVILHGMSQDSGLRDELGPDGWAALNRAQELDPQSLRLGVDLDSGRPIRGIWDTMLVQAFFDPMDSVALKKTAKRRLRVDADAAQLRLLEAMKKQGVGLTKRYDLTPWPLMEEYAADDAELTLLLAEDQLERIECGDHPPQLWEQIDKEFELARVLWQMERRGVAYDVTSSRRGAEDLRARMEQLEKELPFNPGKLTEVRAFYFGPESEGGLGRIPLKVSEKTQVPSVDEAQIRLFVNAGLPHAAAYDEWSHCKSALGKWYRGWADRTGPDGRLRTVFKQCVVAEERAGAKSGGTISGRLAVGRVQLHAIPHDSQLPAPVRDRPVRSLITAEQGRALWEMDLPQGEVRIATVVVDCQAMWDVIDTGEDLHGANAKRIFGIGEDHPDYKDLRGVAKRIVFGTLYGAGVRTLRAQILEFTGIDYSENETRAAKEAFERTYPEFPRVARRIQRKADRNLGGPGYVTLIDGRRRWFGPEEFSYKAFNAVIQGGLAQTGKAWMIQVERELPGIQVLAIHDSIVVEVEDSGHGASQAQRVADIGRQVYERDYGIRGRRMSFEIVPERWNTKH